MSLRSCITKNDIKWLPYCYLEASYKRFRWLEALRIVVMKSYVLAQSDSTAKYCRFVDRFIAESVEDLTVLALKEFIQRFNIDVVIPTEDEYALWLSHNKNAIENEIPVKCAVEGPEKLEMVLNKTTLLNFLPTAWHTASPYRTSFGTEPKRSR